MNFLGSLTLLSAIFTSEFAVAHDDFIQNHFNFATKFYTNLIADNADANIAFSPLSLQSCFSMLYIGTKGVAAHELAKGFCLGSSDRQVITKNFKQILDDYKSGEQLQISNKIYVDQRVKLVPEFKSITIQDFHSDVETCDLKSGERSAISVNNWINEKTKGNIQKLFNGDDFNVKTVFILLNIIYFKGKWKTEFRKQSTQKDKFWISETKTVEVDMMHVESDFKYKSLPDHKVQVVELPYADSQLSMLLFVPNEQNGLWNFEQSLKNISLLQLSNDMYSNTIDLYLPKFEVETSIDLRKMLPKIGVEKIFKDPDFSDLLESNSSSYSVDKAYHKTIVKINEEGTEAAAAAGMSVTYSSMDWKPIRIRADKPFLFIVKDNAGRIFFMGRFLGH